MNRLAPLLVILFTAGCLSVDPADADDAQEAVARHLAGQSADGPWEAICLDREHEAGQEDEATFQRRFDGHRLPVVPARRCEAADGESFERIVEGTGEVALVIIVRSVHRSVEGSLVVTAGTSTGTIDHAEYECTLVRHDSAWQVEACVVTVLT